jgi:Flp pilus assembly protein TadG
VSRRYDLSGGRVLGGRHGQVLITLTLALPLFLGLVSLVADFGMIYLKQSRLNASAQAAALAGAWAMAQPGATTTSVQSAVTSYSGSSGDKNSYGLSNATLVSGYPSLECLTTLQTLFGISCYGPSNTNALVVKEQITVPLAFAGIFGFPSVKLTAVATAGMRGASATPLNVAIIVDGTQSMNSTDSSASCNDKRINCAMAGVQVLLKGLSPCLPGLTSCGTVTNGNVPNSLERVSLMSFPPVTTATVTNDYSCGGTSPTTVAYATPFPPTSTYQILDFSSDYRSSDSATTLKSTSRLVAAVAGNSGNPCLSAKGGFGTYYAQAIYAAQTYLVAEQAKFPNSQNVIILLSDGDATASCSGSSGGVCNSGQMPGASTTSGTYVSTLQECHQAITAAHAASVAGTRVYAVAYGSPSTGCATDTAPTITPCQTMQQIASSPGYFFSDYTATGGSNACVSASQPATALKDIFQAIVSDFTFSKLIPNNTQ